MKEQSLMKQTVVLTAKLVGAFTLWTLLLAFVVVGLTSRAVLAFSGGASRASSGSNITRPNG